jgi:hypothetical protein
MRNECLQFPNLILLQEKFSYFNSNKKSLVWRLHINIIFWKFLAAPRRRRGGIFFTYHHGAISFQEGNIDGATVMFLKNEQVQLLESVTVNSTK